MQSYQQFLWMAAYRKQSLPPDKCEQGQEGSAKSKMVYHWKQGFQVKEGMLQTPNLDQG